MMDKKNTLKRLKKAVMIFVAVIGCILIIAGIFIKSISGKNVNAMNRCIDKVLQEIEAKYILTEADPGEYRELKLWGLIKFKVKQYEIEELGNLSIMRVNMGVMQMATVVITPRDKNMPLLSADYMYILNNRKNYLEYYDLVATKDKAYEDLLAALSLVQGDYEHLQNIEVSQAWYEDLLTVKTYKGGTSSSDEEMEGLLTDSIAVYLDHAKGLPFLSEVEREEKLNITKEYTNGLIEKGGISTDVFKEQLGDEVTADFFDKVFFGTLGK